MVTKANSTLCSSEKADLACSVIGDKLASLNLASAVPGAANATKALENRTQDLALQLMLGHSVQDLKTMGINANYIKQQWQTDYLTA